MLKIPWKNLYGAPVEAVVEGLYLLVVPNLDIKYDPEKEEKYEFETKQNELKRIEEAKKKEAEKDKPKVDDTFVEKLTTQIIKNVQIRMKDIHIRYEDKVTHKTKPFSFGITLSNLSVETTDENWQPAIIKDALSKIYKVLSLDGLAMYWNCNSELYANKTHSEITEKFKEGVASRDILPKDFLYILGPIWSSARLRLNPKPENDMPQFSTPKVLLNLEMEKLTIGISKAQYQDIVMLGESMDRMNKGLPFRKFRPNVPIIGNSRLWWRFAYNSVLIDIKRKRRNWDWLHISEHREQCREYATLYQQKLKNKKLSADVKQKIEKLEKKLDVFNIVIIRQRIELEVERIHKKTEELSKNKSWFSGWFGRAATEEDADLKDSTNIMKKFEEAMTPAEKSKLYRAIDYQENSAPADYPLDYEAVCCAFLLHGLQIEVRDDSAKTRVLHTELKGVNCRLLQKPAASALRVAVKIDEFVVYGLKQNDIIPQFVSSVGSSEGIPLIDVLFEVNPDKTCGQRLHIKSQPLRIIYDAQTVIKIVDVFQTPPELRTQLQLVAGNQLSNLNEMTAIGMQYAIEQHSHLDLNIDFSAPYIILPYGGFYTGKENIIVVNLGHVKVTSIERADNYNVRELYNKGTTEGEILQTVMLSSYDKFLCELSNVQILLARPQDDWQLIIKERTISALHLLEPMSINVSIQKCLVCDDPRLPKMKIDGELPSIMLNISDQLLLTILELLTSIPFPKSEEPEIPLRKTESRASHLSGLFNIDEKLKKAKEVSISEGDTFVQSTDICIKFAMKEFTLLVSRKTGDGEETFKRLLKLTILNLELDMIQQTFNMKVDLRLGGVGLKQYIGQFYHDVISTPMTDGDVEYLLVVTYQQVNKKSPEFYTRYHSCEQSVQLLFTSLSVQLHQEGLQKLIAVLADFQPKLEQVLRNANQDRVAYAGSKTKFAAIVEEGLQLGDKPTQTSFKPKPLKPRKKILVETISFKLTARLKEFNILFKNQARDISSVAIKGIHANVIVKSTYTQLDANLQDLVVLDLDPNTKHKKIICATGEDNALGGQIVIFNIDETDIIRVNMSIQIRMGRLRILFLNSYLVSMLRFLNNFQTAQQAILDAAAEAAEAAKQNVTNIYQNATRIDLDVKMVAPNIIIPANTQSLNAIALDLGYITVKNKFLALEVENDFGQPAIVDDLNLTLNDLKLMRVQLDEDYQNKYECTILRPISFSLWIKRNLSTSWYTSIPDIDLVAEMKMIVLNLNQCDYAMMMQVLNENLTELPPGEKKSDFIRSETGTSYADTQSTVKKKTEPNVDAANIKVNTFLKYTFTMESLVINLFKEPDDGKQSVNPHNPTNGLATFSLDILSLKGSIFSDGSIVTSLLLVDCLLDDTRAGREGKLTRMMERKEDDELAVLTSNETLRSMFDLTFQQKNDEMFIDIRIYSFNLILSIDYMMRIAAFFTAYTVCGVEPKKPSRARTTVSKSTMKTKDEPKESTMTLNLRIEKPDIILVEKMDNIDVMAMIMNTDVTVSMKMCGEYQNIRGTINDLQLYTCSYNPNRRKDTTCPVLRPCSITITGVSPEDEKGLNLDILLTPIKVAISPQTIDLLNRIVVTLTTSDEDLQNEQADAESYTEIWQQKQFNDSDYWFLKTEIGTEVDETEDHLFEQPIYYGKEHCIVSAPQFILTMEAGMGTETLPLLLLEACFDAQVKNWSSAMAIESQLSVQMGYYNNELAIWEPLIEPVESIGERGDVKLLPWSLKIDVQMQNTDLDTTDNSLSPDEQEEIKINSKMVVNVTSKATLELVITRTCMEVINNLLRAFQTAVKEGVPSREVIISPYKVINDTGLKLTLKLLQSDFEYFSRVESYQEYQQVVLESGAEVPLQLANLAAVSDLTMELGLGLSSTYMLKTMEEKKIIVHVDKLNCDLEIPVVRADKRYFNLNYRGESNDTWGIVSDITVQGAQTIVTLRSMLRIHNHFDIPIDVYYMTNRGNELEFIKKVEGSTAINIPLQAVYTLTNEFFFSVHNHTVTAVPYVWKDLKPNLTVVKILHCPPINENKAGPFIMKVRGETEQIYFENTSKHTMSSLCYTIHIRPTITFRNYLPYPVTCIVQGDLKETVVEPGDLMHLPTVHPGQSYVILKVCYILFVFCEILNLIRFLLMNKALKTIKSELSTSTSY